MRTFELGSSDERCPCYLHWMLRRIPATVMDFEDGTIHIASRCCGRFHPLRGEPALLATSNSEVGEATDASGRTRLFLYGVRHHSCAMTALRGLYWLVLGLLVLAGMFEVARISVWLTNACGAVILFGTAEMVRGHRERRIEEGADRERERNKPTTYGPT